MCASAIRWAGFKEVIYGSSIRTIAESRYLIFVGISTRLTVQMAEIKFTSLLA
jgi:tRNA(Arg) A34 adenosine deaminase TadA